MEAIEFINRYTDYISRLEKVVKPEHYFNSDAEAMGVVFKLFLKKLNSYQQREL